MQEAIRIDPAENAYTVQRIKDRSDLKNAAVLYPVHSGIQILQLHKFFIMGKVKKTLTDIRKLQTDIQKTIPNLPPGKFFSYHSCELHYNIACGVGSDMIFTLQ